MNEVNIEEKRTTYNVKLTYHSDMKCENYDAEIEGIEEANGRISIVPNGCEPGFIFHHSDPDRVIAIAQMMLNFAQMVKNENKVLRSVDISNNQ